MITPEVAIIMIQALVFATKIGKCKCTHRKNGDIKQICKWCEVSVALDEICDVTEEQYEQATKYE